MKTKRSFSVIGFVLGSVSLLGCDILSPESDRGIELVWRVALPENEAGWHGRPAVVGTMIVAETGPGLTAFDLTTGAIVWNTTLRSGAAVGGNNVAYGDGRVFVAGGDSVYALVAVTGERLWAFLPDAQAALGETLADEQAVYFGTRSHLVYSLDAATGVVRWVVDIGSDWTFFGIVRGIARSGDTLYVTASQHLNSSGGLRTAHVIALDRRTGEELWRHVSPGNGNTVGRSPGVVDDVLLLGDLVGLSFFALDRATGRELWRVKTAPGSVGVDYAPSVRDGVAYATSSGGVYAADLRTGETVWKLEGPPLIGGRDIQVCGNGLLYSNFAVRFLDPDTGGPLGIGLDGNDEFATSAFAISGNRAFVVGNRAAYGFVCG